MAEFRLKTDPQRDSSAMTQLELRIARMPARPALDVGAVRAQRSMTGAINLCINASGLSDKEVADALDIDQATWSRIRSRQAYFPQDKLDSLVNICGNEAPLLWWADQRGYELKPLRGELEQRIADLEQKLADKDRDLAVIRQFVRETR